MRFAIQEVSGALRIRIGWRTAIHGYGFRLRQGQLHQVVLRGEGLRFAVRRSGVAAVGLQKPRLEGIAQVRPENLSLDTVAQLWDGHRKHRFAALVEVARHPVRAAAEDFSLATVGEGEDAAVLEKAANDAADADALAQAFDAGTKSAHAANDQVDLDAGFGGGVERLDQRPVEQGIHFGHDGRGPAGAGVLGFAHDQLHEVAGEGQRSDHERPIGLVVRFPCERGEVTKHGLHGGGDFGARGEQTDVGVEPGSDRVVIACAQVGVSANHTVRIAPDQKCQLAVGLEAEDAVVDPDAGILQFARPADI